jgi:hypothetical protein
VKSIFQIVILLFTKRTAIVLSACAVFVILILSNSQSFAQETDSLKIENQKKPHSIKRATIYSAVLPGLGQGYNKKYWKIPIVYAGFGVMTYFIVTNINEFNKYKEAYVYKANGETYPIDNEYVDRYNLDQLESGMDTYRRYRDISYIVTALWYVINILDANVDAHFVDYDISDDLTINWEPYFQPVRTIETPVLQPEAGLRITLNF